MSPAKDLLLMSGWNSALQIWDTNTMEEIKKIPGKQEFGVHDLAVQCESPLAVWTGSFDGSLCLWT